MNELLEIFVIVMKIITESTSTPVCCKLILNNNSETRIKAHIVVVTKVKVT